MFSNELKKLWTSVGGATFIYLAFVAFQYFDGGERLAEYFDPHPEAGRSHLRFICALRGDGQAPE